MTSLAMAGYLWQFEIDRQDIISVSEERSAPTDRNLRPGESLTEKFLVLAINPGTAKIVFSQKRSWEQNNMALAIQIFTVIVS